MRKKKFFYVALNLLTPGFGQFAIQRWLTGSLILSAFVIVFIWILFICIRPIWHNVAMMIEGGDGELIMVNFIQLGAAFLIAFFICLWSILDIVLRPDKDEET